MIAESSCPKVGLSLFESFPSKFLASLRVPLGVGGLPSFRSKDTAGGSLFPLPSDILRGFDVFWAAVVILGPLRDLWQSLEALSWWVGWSVKDLPVYALRSATLARHFSLSSVGEVRPVLLEAFLSGWEGRPRGVWFSLLASRACFGLREGLRRSLSVLTFEGTSTGTSLNPFAGLLLRFSPLTNTTKHYKDVTLLC